MRLIDADEFQKQIAGMAILNNYPPNKANALCELVDNQPTGGSCPDIHKDGKHRCTHRRIARCKSNDEWKLSI